MYKKLLVFVLWGMPIVLLSSENLSGKRKLSAYDHLEFHDARSCDPHEQLRNTEDYKKIDSFLQTFPYIQNESVEDLAIRLIYSHAISEQAFHNLVHTSTNRKNYRSTTKTSWWDHAQAANNHVIMNYLQRNGLYDTCTRVHPRNKSFVFGKKS